MHHLIAAIGLAAAVASGPASAQSPLRLSLPGADPALARLAAAAVATLREPAPRDGRPLALRVLLLLRCGDLAASAATLAAAAAPADAEAARWTTLAHLWHARAAGTPALPPARWRTLAATLAAAAPPDPAAGFAPAALAAHALLAADLLAAAEPDRAEVPGAPLRDRAIGELLALEAATWQPGLGCFRAAGTNGAILPPVAGTPVTLLPAACGLLLASGDRLPRHLARVLADAAPAEAGATALDAAWCLGAATQLGDDAARAVWWRRLFAAAGDRVAADEAGFVLDAALFALTGARVATGAGVDEAWQRFAPWLPPGLAWLEVPDLALGGGRYRLRLERRDGPRRADEADGTAHLGGDGPRLWLQLDLAASHDGRARTVVVSGRDVQTVHWLAPGTSFCASLPGAQPDAQHDAHEVGSRAVGDGAADRPGSRVGGH